MRSWKQIHLTSNRNHMTAPNVCYIYANTVHVATIEYMYSNQKHVQGEYGYAGTRFIYGCILRHHYINVHGYNNITTNPA